MSNKKTAISSILVFFLTFLGIFLLSSCNNSNNEEDVKLTPITPSDENIQTDNNVCWIENCHGLDITCGSNVPEVCTAMYELWDNCRKYASCKQVDGECKLEESEDFKNCKACIKKCEENTNWEDIFECGNKCSYEE